MTAIFWSAAILWSTAVAGIAALWRRRSRSTTAVTTPDPLSTPTEIDIDKLMIAISHHGGGAYETIVVSGQLPNLPGGLGIVFASLIRLTARSFAEREIDQGRVAREDYLPLTGAATAAIYEVLAVELGMTDTTAAAEPATRTTH